MYLVVTVGENLSTKGWVQGQKSKTGFGKKKGLHLNFHKFYFSGIRPLKFSSIFGIYLATIFVQERASYHRYTDKMFPESNTTVDNARNIIS